MARHLGLIPREVRRAPIKSGWFNRDAVFDFIAFTVIAVMFVIVFAFMFWPVFARARDAGQWEATEPQVRSWYKNLKQPDNKHQSCCGEADAYWADKVVTRYGKNYAIITDTRDDAPLGRPHIDVGTEIEIPDHKMKWDAGNPTGHGILFVSPSGTVFCFVDGGGV